MNYEQAQQLLSQVLFPLDYDTFFQQVVGQRPALVRSGADNLASRLMLGDDPRQQVLAAYQQYADKLTCHALQPTGPAPARQQVDSAAGFASLLQQYHQHGLTVRVPDVNELTPALAAFNRALTQLFGNPAGTVIFWSQAGARAPVHDDEVDVIAIQLYGKKRWFISDDAPRLSNSWKAIGAGVPPMGPYSVYDVGPGDLLYIPRGTTHTVESTTESLHLSIGFVPVTVREAMCASVNFLADFDRRLRQDLGQRADAPAERADLALCEQQICGALEMLLQQCRQPGFIQAALAHRQAQMLLELPKLPAPVADVSAGLGLHSRLCHHPLAISQLNAGQDMLDLRIPGEQLLLHPGVGESLAFISQTPAFTVSQIPGAVTDEVRLALVQRLLSSGFLQRADAQVTSEQ